MLVSAGPFALPLNILLLGLAFFVAILAGWLVGRKRGISVEPALSNMLLFGVLAARTGFVLQYLSDYLAQPLSIFDIRDGGFSLWAGVAAAAGVGLFYGWRQVAVRAPLAAAAAAGFVTWAVALGGTSLLFAPQAQLPGVALTTLDGKNMTLAEFSGRPLVVNLWATWCPPCRREMPVLAAAQQAEEDISFVFVNQGETSDVIRRYMNKEQLQLNNVLVDLPSSAMQQLGTGGLPSTYFFNADGELVDTHFGELSTATLKQNLRSIQRR